MEHKMMVDCKAICEAIQDFHLGAYSEGGTAQDYNLRALIEVFVEALPIVLSSARFKFKDEKALYEMMREDIPF